MPGNNKSMSQSNILNQTFDTIEKSIHSELFVKRTIYDRNSYDSVNYTEHVLVPFIDDIFAKINILFIDESLISKMQLLIEKIQIELDSNEIVKVNSRMARFQKSRIKFLISKLSDKKLELLKLLEDSVNIEDTTSGLTNLSKTETILLIQYLQQNGAIKSFNKITNTDLSQYFSKLTGYSAGQLRKMLSRESSYNKNLNTTKRDHYNNVRSLLTNIIANIDKDLESFN